MNEVKKKMKNIFGTGRPSPFGLALGKRIRQIRAALALSQAEMSHALGRANNNAVSRLERGDADLIPYDILDGLARMAVEAGYSVEWFLTGRESAARLMAADVIAEVKRQTADSRPAAAPVTAASTFKVNRVIEPGYKVCQAESLPKNWRGRWVPILGKIAAGAGIDTVAAESQPVGLADKFVRWDWKCEKPFAVEVCGESMEPKFHDRDVVIVDGGRPATDGICCVIFAEGGDRLVRLKRLMLMRGKARLESLNPKFPPVILPAQKLVAAYEIAEYLPFLRDLSGKGK
jgi:SOS-response transcriptional repressor LexA/DNA-binding XRE family transcriptional regulator